MTTIHDVRGIFNAAQRVAAAQGLTLQEEEGCTQPRTDLVSGKVWVAKLNPYWSAELIDKWLGELYHECGHHAPEVLDTLPFMQEKKIGFNCLKGHLINVFDDVRQEMNGRGLHKGRDESLSRTQAHYCDKGADALEAMGLPDDKDKLITAQALAMAYDWRSKYQPDLALPSERFSRACPWDSYSHLQPLLDTMYTIEDVHDLVVKMLEESPDHDPEQEQQEAEEQASEEGTGEDSDGEGDGSGEAKDGTGKSEESDKDGEAKVGEVSYEDLMGHKHKAGGVSEFQSKIKYDHKGRRDYIPWAKMLVQKARDLESPCRSNKSHIEGYYTGGRSLAATARRLFQSVTQSRKSHNHLRGRLDKRDLYRIPSGAKDVFTRKEQAPDPKGTAIFLLTDASGSMEGHKFYITAASVALLNDACSPLGIPMKIAAFTEEEPHAKHFIVKEYGEKRSAELIIDDYVRINPHLYQNADGESILWAAKDLMTRPEPRKILIVLSDGCPAADNGGDCYTYTKDVIEHVNKWAGLELYGIGIMDDTVKELYPECEVLDNPKRLEACLLNLIKTKIFI